MIANKKASKQNYKKFNFGKVYFSDKPAKKLMIRNGDDTVYFGNSRYNDFIIYSLLDDPNADDHRRRYLARATKIKGNWKDNNYSPNTLSICILW